jgi:hypothetical protein
MGKLVYRSLRQSLATAQLPDSTCPQIPVTAIAREYVLSWAVGTAAKLPGKDEARRKAASITKLPQILPKQKAPTIAGAKRRSTDWSVYEKQAPRQSGGQGSLSG